MTTVPSQTNISVLLEAVKSFLKDRGWIELPKGQLPNAAFYEAPFLINSKPFTVVLPAHAGLLDAEERTEAVIRTLATLEIESPEQFKKRIMLERTRSPRIAEAVHPNKMAPVK